MKFVILMFVTAFAAQISFAGETREIKPSAFEVALSLVESVKTIYEKGDLRINLVQADNGGSTDVSALFMPSSLYLTVYLEGEAYDKMAHYQVLNNIETLQDVEVEAQHLQMVYTAQVVSEYDEYLVQKSEIVKERLFLGDIIRELKAQKGWEIKASLFAKPEKL